MKNYWTCSKFADWVRGLPKPESGTSEEWREWKKKAKENKYRYWLAEEGIDYLERLICWPANYFNRVCWYLNNRWVSKSHALSSNLKRGSWHEFDTRLLHAIFDELVNFVEVELAWMLVICSSEDCKKYKTPWYCFFFRIRFWRCAEAGMDYLKWAADLKKDDEWMGKDEPDYGKPTQQAIAAMEIMELYKWWKEDRPNRVDAHEASGWNEYCDAKHSEAKDNEDDLLFDLLSSNKKDEHAHSILNKCHEIEKQQDEEDTAMLIRLVKIRNNIWT
jgi:hypothetical protein